MNMIEKRKRSMGQGGFTLIELLVVVAILAILAGVAVFAVGNLTDDADTNACKVEKDTIKTAIQAAKATSDSADTYADYLDGTPKYFTVSGTTITAVSGAPCS
ncbi:type II secretion system protein [Dermatobacter hominis]|uniref:type II secretion system protein n=1 Tax=Dermatobacter hominis TaxID=2884263 RepID=UPI001D10D0CA|nr:prepilin-type N-terminal cleavage/methylation domain-containing protein [Dermatobacter hominis]UDY37960.1 prepilin-type N-terminal cleavage/methylation domain-containing protein [Dermatobacter hominis]